MDERVDVDGVTEHQGVAVAGGLDVAHLGQAERGPPQGHPGEQALLDGEGEALTRKAIEMALSGDGLALRLCLD